VADKVRCMRRARELAAQYTTKYWGCAQSSFSATLDALREEGVELVSKEEQDEIFKGLIGLSGGTGNLGGGTCGALAGTAFAISLASGVGRKEQLEDKMNRWIAFDNVAETIGKQFMHEYGGLRCRDVTWNRWGKWWDSWNPVAKAEFAKEERARGCLCKDRCTIALAAGWAVGYILDILDDPRTLEQMKELHG